MLLIEPDGPFANHDRSLRFCPGRLRCRLSLPPGSDAVNLERPSTMDAALDIRSAWTYPLQFSALALGCQLAVGKPFVSEAANRKSRFGRGYRVGVPSVSSTSDLSTLLARSGSSGIASPSAHRPIAIRPANEIALTRSAWCGAISASE